MTFSPDWLDQYVQEAVSVEEYTAKFNKYYNRVTTELREAQKAFGIEMHRLYNPNSGEHFYTANTKKRDALVSRGWREEGIGWYGLK